MIRFACLLTILILSAVVSVGLLVGTQADISVVMATAGQRELSGRINFQALFGSIKTGELATIHAKVTEAPSRLAGTSSEREVSKFVENEFHRLGLETVIQSYPVTIPVTRWCRITDVHNQQLPGISITPFWPNFVRTCTTPAEGIIGQVVDVGGGSLAELDGKQIEGNIALVTMGQGVGWLDAAKLGATAILFAESDDPVVYNDKHLKFPANLPRFLLSGPPDQVVGKRVRLTARVDWQIREARNVFGVLHPSDQSEEALIILSHTDSWSTVPARAPGFQDACTVTSMLGIARALQTQQDGLSRTVIFGAISGRYSGSEGIRRMLDAVGSRTQNEPNLVRAHRRLAEAMDRKQGLETAIQAYDSQDYWELDAAGEAALWRQYGQLARSSFSQTIANLLNEHVVRAKLNAELARVRWSQADQPSEGSIFEDHHRAMRMAKRTAVAASADLVAVKRIFHDVLDDAQARERMNGALQKAFKHADDSCRYIRDSIAVGGLLGKWKNTYYFFPLHDSSTGPLGLATDTILGNNLKPTLQAITTAWLGYRDLPVDDDKLRASTFFLDQAEKSAGNRPVLLALRRHPARELESDLAGGIGSGILYTSRHAIFFFNGIAYQDNYQTPFDRSVDISSVTDKTQLISGLVAQLAAGGEQMEQAGQDASGVIEWLSSVHGEVVMTGAANSLLPNQRVPGALVVFGGGSGRATTTINKSRDGRFRIPAVRLRQHGFVEAYSIDEHTGQITGAKDQGSEGARFITTFQDDHNFYREPEHKVMVVLSRLTPFDVYRALGPDGRPMTFELLDARFRTAPAQFSITEAWEQGSTAFVPSGDRFYLVLKDMPLWGSRQYKWVGNPGRSTTGFMLNSSGDSWANRDRASFWSRGYLAGRDRRAVFHEMDMATSLALSNHQRLASQKRTGVADPVTLDLAHRAEKALERAISARHQQRISEAYRHVNASAAISQRAYPAVKMAVFDAVIGILMYMSLIVPFSFFAERLVFGFSDIRARIAGILGLFLVVFGIIRLTHPAYDLVTSSLVILVGFIIFILCLLILGFVLGKFIEKMRSLRRASSGAVTEGLDDSQLSTSGAAFNLGINNMRKRPVRTACTLLTLVLLSFCLVSFTAPRPQLKEKQIAIGSATYNGLILREEGNIEALGVQYADAGEFVPRYAAPAQDMPVRYQPVNGASRHAKVQGELYIRSGESEVTSLHQVLVPPRPGMRGRWFRDGESGFCYLSDITVRELGLDPLMIVQQNVFVHYRGNRLAVYGVFDSEKLDAIRDADRERITPLDFRQGGSSQALKRRQQQAQQFSQGAGVGSTEGLPHLRGAETILLPLGPVPVAASPSTNIDGVFTSAAVVFKDQSYGSMRQVIDQVLDRTPTFVRYTLDGIAFFGARLRSVGLHGYVDIVIPLIVGAFIVFNTMLGSVYERKQEIAIYSAVGLSPRHVFFLFLAESIVYAIIGVVGGYVLALSLQWISHLGDNFLGLTMNFSSRSAIYVSLTLIAVVIVSSFVPAYHAARAAAPSENITWQLPEASSEGQLVFDLPFTFIGRDILAAVPFVQLWLDEHGEDSSGEFAAKDPRVETTWINHEPAFTVVSTVWLRPYDLGVSQKVRVTVQPSDDPTIYQVAADIQLLTGGTASWRRTNAHFIRLLRHHLLSWRRLSSGQKTNLFQTGVALTNPQNA